LLFNEEEWPYVFLHYFSLHSTTSLHTSSIASLLVFLLPLNIYSVGCLAFSQLLSSVLIYYKEFVSCFSTNTLILYPAVV